MEKLQQLSTPQIFEHYNALISNTRGKLFNGLGYEIGENTFIYYKPYFSSAEPINGESIGKKVSEAQQIISNLQELEKELSTISQLNNEQKELLTKVIHKEITLLQYHSHAMYIEAEKAGYQQDPNQISFHSQEKLKLEEELYGHSLLEIPYRASNVAQKLNDLYAKGNNLLDDEEKTFRETTIAPILQPYAAVSPTNSESKENVHDTFISEHTLFPLVNVLLEIEGLDKEHILNIQMDETITQPEIKDSTYHIPNTWKDSEIEKYFEECGMKNHFKVIKQVKGNASVHIAKGAGEDFEHNHIKLPPATNGKYNLTQRVLPVLFDHEIATHVKTGIGNITNHNISTNGYLDFEEGVAVLNQHMANHNTLEGFYEASIGDIGQFLGEQLNDKELLQALNIIMKKLDTTITLTPEERARRIRIGVPLGYKGARRSDMSYGSGRDIIKQLEEMSTSQEGIETLKSYAKAKYGTKLAFQDVEQIDKILEGIGSLEELKVAYPNFVGKILYWKLFKGKLSKEEMLKTDIRALVAEPNTLSYAQKRLLVQMLDIIRKDLMNQEHETQ